MARHLTLTAYTRRASRASTDAVTLYAGGQQLGRQARLEGLSREANPFREGAQRGVRRDGDRYQMAAMGWDAGYEEATKETE
jgi:hypothetical protein